MNAFKGFGFLAVLMIAALIAGCASPKSGPVYADVPGASVSDVTADSAHDNSEPAVQSAEAPAESAADSDKPELIVTPDTTLTGSIVSVNDVGRFVVLSFPVGRLPAENSTLYVYRQGLKVAELKVTGPQKDDHTVADIRTGECRVKDEVRNR